MTCPKCGRDLAASGLCPHCSTAGYAARSGAAADETYLEAGHPRDSAEGTATHDETLPGAAPHDDTRPSAAPHDDTRPGAAPLDDTHPGGPSPPATRGVRLNAGDAFGTRYRILKVLGAGGMGVVYQAWDQTLNVVVALKVIRPEAAPTRAAARDIERRFKRELLLARQVTHKSVVRIHDLGDVEGTKYITMSFVEGDDLATILKRDGALPIARVLHFARQIACGLEAAHEAGVVHRDLKPANIMVDQTDQALIMDFGIALSAGPDPRAATAPVPPPAAAPEATGDETVLQPEGGGTVMAGQASGRVIGTLEYMSPEQSKGEAVDHRTDIYAFGWILTDLLLGPRSAPPGTTPWQALTARIQQPPQPITARRAEVPEAFDALIAKCLQLNPADRFQTTGELVAAIDRLDDTGNLIPEAKRLTPKLMALAGVAVLVLLGSTWWVSKGSGVAPPSEPVSVLIADFTNSSGDPVFNGLIEQALAVGVEGASFISAYPRRDALREANRIKAGASLDGPMAKLISMREGLDVMVAGDISRRGNGYRLAVKATRPDTDAVLLDWSTNASSKDDVLTAVGRVAERVRQTLGDTETGSKTREAETFTAASLEAAKAYAEAQELQWAGKWEEAIAAYQRTLGIDPNFGRAHAGIASAYTNLGRPLDAEASYQAALSHLDRMTEREKMRTRGSYYLFRRDPDKAIKEFEPLIAKYPADTSGLANLALAHFYKRDMKSALDMGRRASDIYPKNLVRKNNAALFAMYAGDFDTSATLAGEALELNPAYPKAFVAQALSHLAQGRPAEAAAVYGKLAAVDTAAAKSFAATGLIDLALYEGRQRDALALLDAAIKVDRAAGDRSSIGLRLAVLAELLAGRGDKAGALKAAREAVSVGAGQATLYPAGRALISAGKPDEALALAAKLDQALEVDPRIYGALLRGEAELAAGRPREAIAIFEKATALGDTWLGRLSFGRAYLALGDFLGAVSEFDRCLTRRGEATAAFLDDLPTYRLLPPVHYYLGRAQEGLKSANAPALYKTFLAIKEKGDEQGLVTDARKRLAAPASR